MSAARAVVIVPARNEAERVAGCLAALARQTVPPRVILVDDGSTDGTGRIAATALARGGLEHEVLRGPGAGVGWARRVGFDRAARWALRAGAPATLLVSTDADSVADPGWIAALLRHAERGADVVAGDVLLRRDEPADPVAVARRRQRARGRLRAVRAVEPGAAHHHFAAANLALTVDAYETVGGMPTPDALEDEALLRAVRAAGLRTVRAADAVVRTSPRTVGRTPRGLAVDLAADAGTALAGSGRT
ncbi:glycosyltransferase family A protein [Patulibacter sp. SYSU D01012]|uniref:glycosyltransferase n=1 Tax=Patulibacter sp. SYSU D01012 TaxID=2817381 RepID=UPI001B302E02